MKVDLPEPEGPMIATKLPRLMVTEIPRSAFTLRSPSWYVLVRFAMRINSETIAGPFANQKLILRVPPGLAGDVGGEPGLEIAPTITRWPSVKPSRTST